MNWLWFFEDATRNNDNFGTDKLSLLKKQIKVGQKQYKKILNSIKRVCIKNTAKQKNNSDCGCISIINSKLFLDFFIIKKNNMSKIDTTSKQNKICNLCCDLPNFGGEPFSSASVIMTLRKSWFNILKRMIKPGKTTKKNILTLSVLWRMVSLILRMYLRFR